MCLLLSRSLTQIPPYIGYLRRWADRSAFDFVCGLSGSSSLLGLSRLFG
jgi:hypothetical protein